MSKCWWFWLLCVLFVNISSHLLGWFFCFILLKTTFCEHWHGASMQVQIFNTCVFVCFLFCFICLLFCNCIFLTKNKEITLELYFFPFRFYFAFPHSHDGGAVFVLFWMFLSPSTRRIPAASFFFLNASCFFVCLFLIKDTVNYFLTFLYSCSWIVLLCECICVCVL